MDITGKKYGMLTVIERVKNVGNASMWKCKCDCGNEIIVPNMELKYGSKKSCGCTEVYNHMTFDLTGRRFDNVTVLEKAKSKDGERRWVCECDCGNKVEFSTRQLLHRSNLSCGCKKWKFPPYKRCNQVDLSGMQFDYLTVIEYIENGENRGKWKCICKCGNITYVSQTALMEHHKKSCVCLLRNKARKREEKYPNRLSKVYRGMMERCNNEKHISYKNYGGRGIKVCDEWAMPHTGRIAFCDWALANGYDPKAPKGKCTIDRIDINGNYCPENCRIVDMNIQARNHNYPLGKVPVRGVHYSERAQRYIARITVNNHRINLGTFKSLEEAAAVRKAAELKYYGQVLD